jgi:hypothetical protein
VKARDPFAEALQKLADALATELDRPFTLVVGEPEEVCDGHD